MTRIADVMTRGVRTLAPDDSIVLAAQAMQELDVGSIPVCDGTRLVGMVTDRDIVVRAVAQETAGRETTLSAVMTPQPCWCDEEQPVDEVLAMMKEAQLRRMPVVDKDRRLVGIVTLGDLSVKADAGEAGDALGEISEPAEPDRSSQSQASGPAGGGASR
jgi:CBS domain-containing protein